MFPEGDIPDRIPIASSVPSREVAKLLPISATVDLPVSSRLIPKRVKWSVVCIAHDRLHKAH